jgi:S-(hydroxymethyl)glutathione dehydrogenase/alcohol dehydrogenase
MDVRAAVAIAAGKPLEVTTVQLDGPREGEVRRSANRGM